MAGIISFNEKERTDKTLKVLAIGNSFSQDATTYIKGIALADGVDLRVASASIGGCSFERHYNNITNNTTDYHFVYYTPEETYRSAEVSLEQCLKASDWDIITIQQVSGLSGKYETFFPFAPELVSYIKTIQPKAEIRIHMVWAYGRFYPGVAGNGYGTNLNMYNRVVDAYERLAKVFDNAKIIPSGVAMQLAREHFGDSIHRDGFHCSELGRVLTGWVWFESLTGISALDSKFKPQNAKASYMDGNILITDAEEQIIRAAAHEAVKKYR
jgi:beta-glucosidase